MSRVVLSHEIPSWASVKAVLDKLVKVSSVKEWTDGFCELHAAKLDMDSTPQISGTPYRGLSEFYKHFATEEETQEFSGIILPFIAKQAQDLESHCPKEGLNYLRQQNASTVRLGRRFVLSMITTGFLCLHPNCDDEVLAPNLPNLDFSNFFGSLMYSSQQAKLRCMLNYFRRVAESDELNGDFVVSRVVLKEALTESALLEGSKPLCTVIFKDMGKIEDAGAHVLQLDFANEYLGGGVLTEGNVQEEIRFSICPELLVTMAFVESMAPNEAVLMQGFEQFSQYQGYGGKLQFDGNYTDTSDRDTEGNVLTKLSAIDAVPYLYSPRSQYTMKDVMRDINKAYAGFLQPDTHPWGDTVPADKDPSGMWALNLDPSKKRTIATGNWGCGAFGGDAQLKSMLQWITASYAGCPAMIYYTFQQRDVQDLGTLANAIFSNGWKVGRLMQEVKEFCDAKIKSETKKNTLYEYLQDKLSD